MNSAKREQIRRTTLSVLHLPTLPTTTAKLLEYADNPKISSRDIALFIEKDQVLAARLLKLANSAYYGFSRKVATIPHAVSLLGLNTVKELALGFSVIETFGQLTDTNIHPTHFWEHALAVGVASKTLSKNCKPELEHEAFVAGLLHDLGKLVLIKYFLADFEQLVSELKLKPNEQPDYISELDVLGTTHGEIGAWLLGRWNLPQLHIEAINLHQYEGDDTSKHPLLEKEDASDAGRDLALLVRIGDWWTHQLQLGASGYPSVPVLSDDHKQTWCSRLGLDPDFKHHNNFLFAQFQEAREHFMPAFKG